MTFAQDFQLANLDRLESLVDRLPRREALLLRADIAFRRRDAPPPPAEMEEGVALLKKAARDYPDDPNIWYQLGEIYVHHGSALLVGPEEAERAFAKAVELDPSFAPAYVHLINLAFFVHADSARAAKLIETYGRLARGDPFDQMNRIAFGLAFGDSALRSRALSALDTLPAGNLDQIAWDDLSHPRLQAAQQIVFQAMLRRAASAGPDDGYDFFNAFGADMARGKVHAAVEFVPRLPLLGETFRQYSVYLAFLTGLTELPPASEQELTTITADSSRGPDISFYAGAYAADRGRWDDYDAALARLRRRGTTAQARRDSTDESSAAASALEGYGLWRRGRPAEALPILESAQRHLPPGGRNAVVRWWLGQLLLEMGRPLEAQRYFSSFRSGGWLWRRDLLTPAEYFLAKTYEAQGEYERAREAYAYVAASWSDADPELQPVVENARAAAARLTKLIPE